MTLKTRSRAARTIPTPEIHDIIIYKCRGMTSSIAVTKVESRGGTPSRKETDHTVDSRYIDIAYLEVKSGPFFITEI